ncbi:lipase member H [Monomorium pharaonis]|uniref:lipase member H n=1 Tax=Monomorium pharaonis TaxID=307658 RepID=UPI00063F6E30|nr:lipase member H [Monomorium pharaonis]
MDVLVCTGIVQLNSILRLCEKRPIIWFMSQLSYMEVVRIYITLESSLCVEWHIDTIQSRSGLEVYFLHSFDQFLLFKMLPLIIHLYVILLIFVTKIIHGQSLCSCNQTDLDFATGVNLLYYKCNGEIPATIAYPITVPQTLLNVLDDNQRIIFYVYGYLQFPEDKNVLLMVEALCHGRTDNVVLLDWSKYSMNGSYASVFRNAEKVGSLFAQSIRLLVDSGLDVSKIYIIGHSLGAHIAGFVGKCNSFKISRITALDPANPIFYFPGCYLTHNDAMWVDVIHTDIGGYGTLTSVGTADYYVNGGTRPQPGCKLLGLPLSDVDLCSHQKSVVLYAKLKLHPMKFEAKECPSFFRYILNDCYKVWQIDIGYAAANIRGSFYFRVNTI